MKRMISTIDADVRAANAVIRAILKATFLLLLILVCTLPSKAQVNIGSSNVPEKAALLQLADKEAGTPGGVTAEKGGILLPRTALKKKTELFPFFPDTATGTPEYETEKLKHKGLVVYNIATVEEEGLFDGFYLWNGSEWTRLMEAPEKARATLECDRTRVNGDLYEGITLNTENYMTIYLQVIKRGTYDLLARSGNGYVFQSTGTFDAPGSYTVNLPGTGKPLENSAAKGSKDTLSVYLNGEELACDTEPLVEVKSTVVDYKVNCGKINVNGDYIKGVATDASHYITIPIVVDNESANDDPVIFSTDRVNGINFTCNAVVKINGTTELQLFANGTPSNAGTYQYNFTTTGATVKSCSFEVRVTSTLGSFENPAKSCYAIYQEDPSNQDGEYWIYNPSGEGSSTRTYCDMTNGGYTLIWSYSEKTAHTGGGIYGTANRIDIGGTGRFENNAPQNEVTSDTSKAIVLKYENFRLNLETMKNIRNKVPGEYRVRITDTPTDMNDAWGANNYLYVTASATNRDLITGSGTPTSGVAVNGKLFGLPYSQGVTADRPEYNGVRATGGLAYCYINSSTYNIHWDVGTRLASASTTYTSSFPKAPELGGEVLRLSFRPYDFNNLFGGHHEGEINHHFGKCGQNGDDYSFDTQQCSEGSRYPHSFNKGEGRYLQWWVK